jgi:DNA-binding NarL/FixJ family response regulator
MTFSGERSAVLLDPYPLWLDAVERLVERTGLTVVAKTTDPRRALELVAELQPEALVAEIKTTDGAMDGVDCIREARARASNLRVIVLSESDEASRIDAAFAAGADAYVIKTAHPDDVSAAVRQAFDHSVYFATQPARAATRTVVAATNGARPESTHDLTKRELEILRLVAEGHSNAAMARMLWVTEQTVKFHLSNIYRKLDVANRTEAGRWAQRHGLLVEGEVATA